MYHAITVKRFITLALYLPVVCAAAGLLYPRLSNRARILLTALLAGQVIFALLNLETPAATSFEKWLWYEDGDKNVFALFSASHLALASLIAFSTASRTTVAPASHRYHFIAAGLYLLILTIEEYFRPFRTFAKYNLPIKGDEAFGAIGVIAAALILAKALRSPRRDFVWYSCILLGLAFIAAGGLFVDQLHPVCNPLASRFHGCFTYQSIEEAMEVLGSWIVLLGTLGLRYSGPAPPPFRLRRIFYPALVFVALLLASYTLQLPQLLQRAANRYDLDHNIEHRSVYFESGLRLTAYQTDLHPVSVTLFVSSNNAAENTISLNSDSLGFSIHLVDQVTGQSVAAVDARAIHANWLQLRESDSSSTYRLTLPIIHRALLESTNRATWIVLTIWREQEGEFISIPVTASDLPLLSDTQVILGEIVRPAPQRNAAMPPLARLQHGISLAKADMPSRATAGRRFHITFTWRSENDGLEDLSQFLHMRHLDSGEYWTHDQHPLGDRLPTHLWYAGLADSETWSLDLPADIEPGLYAVSTGLYRSSDGQRIAAFDHADKRRPEDRIIIGTLALDPP